MWSKREPERSSTGKASISVVLRARIRESSYSVTTEWTYGIKQGKDILGSVEWQGLQGTLQSATGVIRKGLIPNRCPMQVLLNPIDNCAPLLW